MFTPLNNNVTAPVTTPVFATPAANADISTYLGDFRATDMNTIATIGAIVRCMCVAAIGGGAVPVALRNNARKAFVGDSYNAIEALMAAPAAAPADDNELSIIAIRLNEGSATNWLADLINAAKKKPISDTNVEGYFAMLGHSGTKPGVVARLINQVSVFFPDSVATQAFRDILAPGIWTTYRVTRVSSGIILRELLPDFITLRIVVHGDADEIAILDCSNSPWDVALATAIPDRLKAYGCIFLQTAGTPIDSWYQGNRAMDDMAAAKVRGAKDIFRKYLEVKNAVDVDVLDNVAAFATSDAVRDFF